jgi:hypothetical protein
MAYGKVLMIGEGIVGRYGIGDGEEIWLRGLKGNMA